MDHIHVVCQLFAYKPVNFMLSVAVYPEKLD